MAVLEPPALRQRVVRAAEGALEEHRYASALDVLMRMGLLAPSQVELWRKGRFDTLDKWIQGSREKIEKSLALFREWAVERGLVPMEACYARTTRAGEQEMRITGQRLEGLEEKLRTHYASPELSQRRRLTVEKRIARAPERVVFWTLQDSSCSECGAELPSGSFLLMEANQPLCLACAGLEDLEFLPAGDTALTRQATKYSDLHAVVVRFSRSRKRYERQGILVRKAALRQAEEECAGDASERAREREIAAVARKKQDVLFREQVMAAIRAMFPGCPAEEASQIAAHTEVRGSGRVGRSAAGRKLDRDTVALAVAAAVRHRHTNYDELLTRGIERAEARASVREKVERVLDDWSEGED